MAKQRELNPESSVKGATDDATPFHRMLVAVDESPAAQAALGLVAEWVDGPGADVHFVQVTEERKQRGSDVAPDPDPETVPPAHRLVASAPTLGARNRQLVDGIAAAAEDFRADVIVLGFDRPRLAGHRLTRSLREQIMRATELPVLVAPSPHTDGKRHQPVGNHGEEERAHTEPRYARV